MADAPITNDIKGKVAVVIRGGCNFAEKAQAVQAAGGIGMVVANSEDVLGRLVGTAPDVSIPCAAGPAACLALCCGLLYLAEGIATSALELTPLLSVFWRLQMRVHQIIRPGAFWLRQPRFAEVRAPARGRVSEDKESQVTKRLAAGCEDGKMVERQTIVSD